VVAGGTDARSIVEQVGREFKAVTKKPRRTIVNAASGLVIEGARQEITDKIAREELRSQRREVRAAYRAANSAVPSHHGRAWQRLTARQA
jgi:hypothetical protein